MSILFPAGSIVNTGDINMAVFEAGRGPAVVFVHGFPELAYSWRFQLSAIADAGYRAIAPDMRGYGGTDKPDDVHEYTIQKLVGDVNGMLAAMEIDKAVIVGHDWGAMVAWQMALLAPEKMAGLIALNIPHIPRPPINPVTYMRIKLGKDFYIVNFQKSDEADRKFAEDPAKFINTMMRLRPTPARKPGAQKTRRKPLSLIAELERDEPRGEPLLSEDELDVYASAFEAGGFTGPINWYRNWKHNWKSTKSVSQIVKVPALFVEAADDRIISRKQIDGMKDYVNDLEIKTIGRCGHWTQQEQPAQLNKIMLEWLGRRFPA